MIETGEQLKELIDQQSYDKYYQDIESIGFTGYSKSHISWRHIEALNIEWKDKVVCDLGCFHGYFSLKVESVGADTVIGLDLSEEVLKTARAINAFSKGNVKFLQWRGGDPTPDCDIALCLNMLHHTEDVEETIANIRCKRALFEVNAPQKRIIEKLFKILKEGPSHRRNRILLFSERASLWPNTLAH